MVFKRDTLPGTAAVEVASGAREREQLLDLRVCEEGRHGEPSGHEPSGHQVGKTRPATQDDRYSGDLPGEKCDAITTLLRRERHANIRVRLGSASGDYLVC